MFKGADLRAVRETCGITQQMAADDLSVSVRTVKRWESGTLPVPRYVGEWAEGRLKDSDDEVSSIVSLHGGERLAVLDYRKGQDPSDPEPFQFRNAAVRRAADVLRASGCKVTFRDVAPCEVLGKGC